MLDKLTRTIEWIQADFIQITVVTVVCWLIVRPIYSRTVLGASRPQKLVTTIFVAVGTIAVGIWTYTVDPQGLSFQGYLFLLVVLPLCIGWIANWVIDFFRKAQLDEPQ